MLTTALTYLNQGKFHCVKKKSGPEGNWTSSDMAQCAWNVYACVCEPRRIPTATDPHLTSHVTDGFGRWNYPDAGANQDLSQCADCNSTTGYNDFRFINDVGEVIDGNEGVIQYIQYAANQAQAMGNKAFFMVISLINPHDVLFQPAQFEASGYPPEYLQGDVPLPSTINQTFDTRPTCQSQYQTIGLQSGVTPSTPSQQNGYMYVQ